MGGKSRRDSEDWLAATTDESEEPSFCPDRSGLPGQPYWEPEGCHRMGRGELKGASARDAIDRLKIAVGAAGAAELADWLDVKQTLVSDAVRRNIIPVAWLQLLVSRKSKYSPVWVLTGEGDRFWD